MTEPIKLPPMEIFDKGTWVWKGQEFTGAELDAAAFAKYRLAAEQATAELRVELDRLTRGAWSREMAKLSRDNADLRARAEKAEAEVERLRAALEAMLSHTADLDPMQGYRPEEDFSAVKQARAALKETK